MRCSACNQENKPSARFCAYCGAALDVESSTLQSGQLVDGGAYRVIRPLGKGGMGAVYLAGNTKAFNRSCVVKEVIEYYDPTDPHERLRAIQRFESEARTLASLKHPGIPDIYAYFSEHGRNYLVMEYIEGPDLRQGLTHGKDGQIVKGRPLRVEDVVRYAIQLCEVLTYLEQRQPPVIHNDIKPANIILDKNSGRAVLVDFGTAKTRYARLGAGRPGRQQSSVYGTVGYAAPELYDGKAEPRSDVYALAATTYHLLTDDDPRAHPFDFPKMDALPEPLRPVLRGALHVDVTERPSAARFMERLENALRLVSGQPSDAPSVPGLTFPQGEKATTRKELLSLCVKDWDYAADMLYDGSLAQWLRTALHDTAAARVAEAAVARYADDRGAGLDHFIRSLDPKAMPQPRLQVSTRQVRYDHAWGQDASQAIEFTNVGRSHLYGQVTSSAPWVRVAGRVRCAPGRTQSLPVVIDTEGLTPGRTYTAKVDIRASGARLASVPVEVRVSLPLIDIEPMQIYLIFSAGLKFTDIRSFRVHNRGSGRVHCQIEGAPPWLTIAPQAFACLPGQTQEVALRGQVHKLLDKGRSHSAVLQVKLQGTRPQQVRVTLQPRTSKERGSRLGAFLMIGFATLFLLTAIIWFLVRLLPLLNL